MEFLYDKPFACLSCGRTVAPQTVPEQTRDSVRAELNIFVFISVCSSCQIGNGSVRMIKSIAFDECCYDARTLYLKFVMIVSTIGKAMMIKVIGKMNMMSGAIIFIGASIANFSAL